MSTFHVECLNSIHEACDAPINLFFVLFSFIYCYLLQRRRNTLVLRCTLHSNSSKTCEIATIWAIVVEYRLNIISEISNIGTKTKWKGTKIKRKRYEMKGNFVYSKKGTKIRLDICIVIAGKKPSK